MIRILNKNTNETFMGEIDTELINVPEYGFAEIPDDGKLYRYIDSEIVEYIPERTQEDINQEALNFFDSTDWKITRHREQIEAGIEAKLTNEEYVLLLAERQTQRDLIKR